MAPSKPPSPALPSAQQQTSKNPPAPEYTNPSFDPVDYLNDVLPPLSLPSQSQPQFQPSRGINLTDLSTRVQTVLSQTNAQNIRHSTTLTTLTDEILRSGNRLAYEVEVLRGETISLSDLLTEGLAAEIARFTVTPGPSPERKSEAKPGHEDANEEASTGTGTAETKEEKGTTRIEEPAYISNLRTLNQVRARLEDVVQTFGDAMEWPLPPSETSLASSFISVSAPEPGPDAHSREEKGQEVARKFRAQILELLDLEGVEAATLRVEALRTLALVWKGTAEERARTRFVEGLAKIVEERQRVIEAAAAPAQQASSTSGPARGHQRQESEGPGGGIFRNLQRLREEIYLE
ncbi:hypothetical protein BJY01DRAFT_204403 [Aspergillus pseudoustus]|uniref:Uncharacterized protein n=1 Tax=Aspergillus pseudoustus TaxID=1810923 RepID=A0ABR4KVQ2_9EURO